MGKRFNTTGSCNPNQHYMVDISQKVEQVSTMVKNGLYFTINRARQFGKTTTMNMLFNHLKDDFIIYSISFEIGDHLFLSTADFCSGLCQKLSRAYGITKEQSLFWKDDIPSNFDDLSLKITNFCIKQEKKVVLLIDEVDKSVDNQLFLNFLGLLRNKYLDISKEGTNSTFHSVILAGVYDVKNLKIKLRPNEEQKYNSPWNIASKFLVDMTFLPDEIKTMLVDYEKDNQTGMNIDSIAKQIYKYTSGYPVLVSEICEIIDTQLNKEWNEIGIQKAVKEIIKGQNSTLIDDISKNLENNKELRNLMYSISINGQSYPYVLADPILKIADMHSYIKEVEGSTAIHNLIFEEVFQQYYTIAYQRENLGKINVSKSEYILNGKLNMPYIIERFQRLLRQEYRTEDEKFLERQGRLLFLCFLKPIINGTGFYYVEPQTRENKRMDIVVTYAGEEFVVELKLWYGEKYETEGKIQLAEYLQTRDLNEGYLITFSFTKTKPAQEEPQWIDWNGKRILEAVV